MAEMAGLALSGVALAALFSTCIEFLEYFEHGKNCTKDVRLALTKLGLMKKRLYQWGTAMSIDPPGPEIRTLRDRWPTESGVISDSLLRIKDILGSTTHMCRRYSSCTGGLYDSEVRQAKVTICASDTSNSNPASPPDGSAGSETRPYRRRALKTIHLKVIWVIQDRKRFQELITDFEFFLNNLEKIGERLQSASTEPGLLKHPPCECNPRSRQGNRLITSLRN